MRCAQFDNEKILSGSWDTTIMVRASPGASLGASLLCLCKFAGLKKECVFILLQIWDVVKFTCIRILRGHQGCVSCLRFNSKYL